MNTQTIQGLLLLLIIFIPLERRFHLSKQKVLRSGWGVDLIYFCTGSILSRFGNFLAITISLIIFDHFYHPPWQEFISAQPLLLQFVAVILLGDLSYYFAHRLLHNVPCLWHFHAVHHSIRQLDWLSAIRVHPVEQIFTKLCQVLPLYCLGFKVEVLAAYFLFSAAMAFFIHANIRWRYGWLNWILVTPQIHRWHHSINPEKSNHNFAAQISAIDRLFGTFYLPKGKHPKIYGVQPPIPNNYLAQFLYPFVRLVLK